MALITAQCFGIKSLDKLPAMVKDRFNTPAAKRFDNATRTLILNSIDEAIRVVKEDYSEHPRKDFLTFNINLELKQMLDEHQQMVNKPVVTISPKLVH